MTETNEVLETRRLILDTAEKIFTDHCDKALLDAAEQGQFPDALWQEIARNGFHQLGSEQSGTSAKDMYAFIQVCGKFALPLPIAQTLLVNQWRGAADTVASIGLKDEHDGRVVDVA